jgi:hypothetical protein
MVNDVPVAPETLVPFRYHWKVGDGDPEAATVKVTELPAAAAWLAGCVVMTGALVAALTVSVAELLVTEPTEFVATTV